MVVKVKTEKAGPMIMWSTEIRDGAIMTSNPSTYTFPKDKKSHDDVADNVRNQHLSYLQHNKNSIFVDVNLKISRI